MLSSSRLRNLRQFWGAYASRVCVFGVSPNNLFRRDAGKLHARTRALPRNGAYTSSLLID